MMFIDVVAKGIIIFECFKYIWDCFKCRVFKSEPFGDVVKDRIYLECT